MLGKAENRPAHREPTNLAVPIMIRIRKPARKARKLKILRVNLTLSWMVAFLICMNKYTNINMEAMGIRAAKNLFSFI